MVKTKKQTKTRNKEIAITILKALGITGLVAGVIVFPGLALVIRWFERETQYNSRQIRQSLYGLRKRKYVKFKTTKKGIKLTLTPKGKHQLLRIKLSELKVEKHKPWDGLWHLAMFDIPEQIRTKRDMIRRHIKKLGFEQIHKSVFITPYPCSEAIDFLRNYYQLPAGSLYVFESRVREGEADLKKVFHLS